MCVCVCVCVIINALFEDAVNFGGGDFKLPCPYDNQIVHRHCFKTCPLWLYILIASIMFPLFTLIYTSPFMPAAASGAQTYVFFLASKGIASAVASNGSAYLINGITLSLCASSGLLLDASTGSPKYMPATGGVSQLWCVHAGLVDILRIYHICRRARFWNDREAAMHTLH